MFLCLQRGMPGGLLLLADELCMEVILNLSPRHVYKLMQTSKRLRRLCTSERYWERVATYVAWAKARETNPLDMVLLPKSYRATMDEYIQGVRDDIGTCFPPYSDHATGPIAKLAALGEERILYLMDGGTPSADTFTMVKRIVEDTNGLDMAVQRSTRGWDVPRKEGFITSTRRATRAASALLRSLEDDQGMDLPTKMRVRAYAGRLLKDIYERRGVCKGRPNGGNPVIFQLHEEDIDASDVYIAE